MLVYGIGLFLCAAGVVLWNRWKTRRIMEHMSQMLDQAMDGEFTEEYFDESLLSAVEMKLARYLAASTVSSKNLRAEKDKIKTLIADISHQTKTPIANICLYTQLLKEQTLSEEGIVCIKALEGQTEKLQALVDAMVKTSRLESGILVMHPERDRLEPMIVSAVSQILPKANQKQMTMIMENTEGSAVYDRKWTEEALFNMLDNAVKYAPEGSEVRVRVKEYPMFSAVEVSDSGHGIPEEEQAKVFQRFYRGIAHSSEEGVGIGLYLVRQIAEGQGGYVKVSSRENCGSTFSIYLPNLSIQV